MNRFNIKIVIAAFLFAAGAAWLAGYVRHGHPGSDEVSFRQELIAQCEDYRTNEAPLLDSM